MIACSYCGKDVERNISGGIIINCDGDHVCDEECKKRYEEERDNFFNHTIHDDKKMAEWLGITEEELNQI